MIHLALGISTWPLTPSGRRAERQAATKPRQSTKERALGGCLHQSPAKRSRIYRIAREVPKEQSASARWPLRTQGPGLFLLLPKWDAGVEEPQDETRRSLCRGGVGSSGAEGAPSARGTRWSLGISTDVGHTNPQFRAAAVAPWVPASQVPFK